MDYSATTIERPPSQVGSVSAPYGLPPYLDVIFVVFVLPFLLLIGILLFDAKVITPRFPSWLRKDNGREANLPAILMGALLAASIAAIYPGMYPARTYANFVLGGAAFDVEPEAARRSAACYGFRDASLRTDLAGRRTREVVLSDGNITRMELRVTHAAPIVGTGWTSREPVVAWAVGEQGLAPWLHGPPSILEGVRLSDVRSHALRAVERTAEKHGLELASKPILIEFGESYDTLLQESRRQVWIVLAPLCLLVFAGSGMKTWSVLRPAGRA